MVNQPMQETGIDGTNYEDQVTTGVDTLLNFLKQNEKMSLSDVAKQLGVGLEVVQSWVDFLVEEKIVGIEYKFTKPFIYLNKEVDKAKPDENVDETYDSIKEDFMSKAKKKNIPQTDLQFLWKNHIKQALEAKKEFFFTEAMKRGLMGYAEDLWEEYNERFLG